MKWLVTYASIIPDNFIVPFLQEIACHRSSSRMEAVIWSNENLLHKADLSVRSNPTRCYEKWNLRPSRRKPLLSRLLHHWSIINHEPLCDPADSPPWLLAPDRPANRTSHLRSESGVVHWRLLGMFTVHHIITSLHLHVRFNTKI